MTIPQHRRIASPCPVCESPQPEFVYELSTWDHYTIERCGQCGFVYSSPRPEPEELGRFYTSNYFLRSLPSSHGYADYRSMAEINAKRMWHDLAKYSGQVGAPPGRVLDVGCATGGFLSEAKVAGWECLGIELSEYAADIARSEYGLTVLQGDIFLGELPKSHFTLLTMWHVLEHLIDPVATLKRAGELLEPGGALFIELPNWASLGRIVKGKAWGQLKPPEHINYFTPASLSAAVTAAGFRIARCTTEYPSLMDQAAVRGWSSPFHQARALIARMACALGHGGYVRLLVHRP